MKKILDKLVLSSFGACIIILLTEGRHDWPVMVLCITWGYLASIIIDNLPTNIQS